MKTFIELVSEDGIKTIERTDRIRTLEPLGKFCRIWWEPDQVTEEFNETGTDYTTPYEEVRKILLDIEE
jgi:hypothetical protein